MVIILHPRKFAKIHKYIDGVGLFLNYKKIDYDIYNIEKNDNIHAYLAACISGHMNYLLFVHKNKIMLRYKYSNYLKNHPEFVISRNNLNSKKFIDTVIYDFDSIYTIGGFTSTPVKLAVKHNQYDVVKHLAKIGFQFTCGEINTAIANGNLKIVKFIIKNRLTVKSTNLPLLQRTTGKVILNNVQLQHSNPFQKIKTITDHYNLNITQWLYENVVEEGSKYYKDFNSHEQYDISPDIEEHITENLPFNDVFKYLIHKAELECLNYIYLDTNAFKGVKRCYLEHVIKHKPTQRQIRAKQFKQMLKKPLFSYN
jgi:hypothetical protein